MIDHQFAIEKIIGCGGSSKVYMAKHVETHTKVAIKVLRKDKEFAKVKGLDIMETEYLRMKTIEGHPNVLKCYFTNSTGVLRSGFECEDVIYNIIEFAENGSLSKIIRSTGGLGEDLAKFYFLRYDMQLLIFTPLVYHTWILSLKIFFSMSSSMRS